MDRAALRDALIRETKEAVAASVTTETLIIQASTTIELLEQSANSLAKKGREWYGLYNPEGERLAKDHGVFLALATGKTKEELLKEAGAQLSMGAELGERDTAAMHGYLESVKALLEQRDRLGEYVDALMKDALPNVAALAGSGIGAKLLAHAGSIARLATVPSSTIQLYGAETALFRHLRDKKKHRSPKYGVLFMHPLVQKTAEKGKAARALADKLSLCAKLDRFKGERKAEEYKAKLAERFGPW